MPGSGDWSGAWVSERTGTRLHEHPSSPGDIGVRALVGLALRRNPRRSHLLVSTVLGKHLPVDPRLARAAGLTLGLAVADRARGATVSTVSTLPAVRQLAAALAVAPGQGPGAAVLARDSTRAALAGFAGDVGTGATEPVRPGPGIAWVLGFGETATGLGQAVAEALGAAAFTSTRRPGGLAVTATFAEAHSHATEHSITAPAGLLRRPGIGVLVDDELSTGATALAAIRALHACCPHSVYVLATLVDVAGDAERARLLAAVAELGARLEIVSLARGRIDLPPDLPAVAAGLVAAAGVDRAGTGAAPSAPEIRRVAVHWPADLPDNARAGLPASLLPRVAAAAAAVAATVGGELDRGVGTGPVLVLGTEEHLDVALRIAEALADQRAADTDDDALDPGDDGDARRVLFSSTTRSPVAAVDAGGYAVRTSLAFDSHDAPADGPGPRWAHNCARPPASAPVDRWSAVVVVVDRAADTPALAAPGGLLEAVGRWTDRVLLVVTGPPGTVVATQDPIRGPEYGSYRPDEVGWLLTDLSTAPLATAGEDREEQLQSGRAHYAESLPVEYEPTAAYRRLYADALAAGARRTALAVGLLAGLLLDRDPQPAMLLSLARAGTPVGVLLRRWLARSGLDVPHLAVSIVRGRGIDRTALEWVAGRYDPARCVFVDGWTGKGAIARELRAALDALAAGGGPAFDADLAVLADPGGCTPLHGTREDWLIPSSCLNSTVSGLVSRTVLNDRFVGPRDHHGGVFYAGLSGVDRSGEFLDAVSGHFDDVAVEVAGRLPGLVAADRTPTWTGWAAVTAVAERYGISDPNLVKPGVGEATRVLLRRMPWQVLVRRLGDPDLAHLERLAAERGVPVVVEPDLPYACIGLIRPVAAATAVAHAHGAAAGRTPARTGSA